MADWLSLGELEDLLQTLEAEEIRQRFSHRLSPEGMHMLSIFEGLEGELAGLPRSTPPPLIQAEPRAVSFEPALPPVQLPHASAPPARGRLPQLFHPLLGSLAAVLLISIGLIWYQRAGRQDLAFRLQQAERVSGQGAKAVLEESRKFPGKEKADEAGADKKQATPLAETSQATAELAHAGEAALPSSLEPSEAEPADELADNQPGQTALQAQSQKPDAPRRKLDLESQAWPAQARPAPAPANEGQSDAPQAPALSEDRPGSQGEFLAAQPAEPNPAEQEQTLGYDASRQTQGASGQSESAAAGYPARENKGNLAGELASPSQALDASSTIAEAKIAEAKTTEARVAQTVMDSSEPARDKEKARKEEAAQPGLAKGLASPPESAEADWLQRFASAWRSGSGWSGLFAEDASILLDLGPPHGLVEGLGKLASLNAQDVQGQGLDLLVRWPEQRLQRLRARIELDERGRCRLLHLR
jgi:hypothetical protein